MTQAACIKPHVADGPGMRRVVQIEIAHRVRAIVHAGGERGALVLPAPGMLEVELCGGQGGCTGELP